MATRRARRPLKGRALVAIGLGAFVVITAIVVWRRSVGNTTERAMRQMEKDRRSLVAQKVTLDNELQRARSRSQVLREAERRLGMHVATEAQTRSLPDSVFARTPGAVTPP
jgi:N-dimethylarginine dimethylaminohydrolase